MTARYLCYCSSSCGRLLAHSYYVIMKAVILYSYFYVEFTKSSCSKMNVVAIDSNSGAEQPRRSVVRDVTSWCRNASQRDAPGAAPTPAPALLQPQPSGSTAHSGAEPQVVEQSARPRPLTPTTHPPSLCVTGRGKGPIKGGQFHGQPPLSPSLPASLIHPRRRSVVSQAASLGGSQEVEAGREGTSTASRPQLQLYSNQPACPAPPPRLRQSAPCSLCGTSRLGSGAASA